MAEKFRVTTNGGVRLGRVCGQADAQLLILANCQHRPCYLRMVNDSEDRELTRGFVVTFHPIHPITVHHYGVEIAHPNWPGFARLFAASIERLTHQEPIPA